MPTRIVTNAHWALSLTTARQKVQELIDNGLSEINYSTGDEHIRFIPMEKVIYAIVAATEMRLPVHVMVELRRERSIVKDSILNHPMVCQMKEEQKKYLKIIESPWMPLNPEQIEKYPDNLAVNYSNLAIRKGCDSILQTYTAQADGRIGSCCGLGLRLIPELNVATVSDKPALQSAIEESESDILEDLWIHYKGPEKILAWASEKNPLIKWENMYAHHCQACQRIYRDPLVIEVIQKHYSEVIADILQCAWIDEDYFHGQIDKQKGLMNKIPLPHHDS